MERITFETAKLAVKKGYNEPVFVAYTRNGKPTTVFNGTLFRNSENNIEYKLAAPYQAKLQNWLRTVHNIHICIELKYVAPHDLAAGKTTRYHASFYSTKDGTSICPYSRTYNTYEEALEAGLQEALKLIKL